MKPPILLLTAIAALAASAFTASAADSQDVMLLKIFGKTKAPTAPPLALTAHALVGGDNSIAVSAWSGALVFEGRTFNGFQTAFAFADPTADRTITFPDGSGTVGLQAKSALTSATTISVTPAASISAYTLTPAHTATINAVTTGAIAGRAYYLVVTTSGTTSYTLTFGTAFKTTGTLASGTVTAKVFVISFIFDGTNFNEVSRTTAM
jgi:hypothetical protein